MLSFKEAIEVVGASFLTPLGSEKVLFADALGRVLAEDILAPKDSPDYPIASMDGYAFRLEDLDLLQTQGLLVQGINPANLQEPPMLKPGCALKSFVGAKMPIGADALVIVEEVQEQAERIFLTHKSGHYNWIRPIGSQYKKGAVVFSRGDKITPYGVGALAEHNQVFVQVYKKPRVGILSGGAEIVEVGAPTEGVRSVNNHMLKAMAESLGGEGVLYPLMPDKQESIEQAICHAFRDCDMVVTTGGMSKGDFDFTQHAIANVSEIAFKGVKIKPGKPVAYSICAKDGTHKPLLALPGNPPAAALTFYLFGAAVFAKLFNTPYTPPFVQATLEEDLEKHEERMEFLACSVHLKEGHYFASLRPRVHLHDSQSALLVLEEGVRTYPKGAHLALLLHHIF
ncbi:Molybdopterin biosynthesis protein MoeA [Helicobacter sp. NHP19-003]|uniref:Molybdopterin molybdenumtransferase n=1 Tax=Helicobacter gastrocanis TaxID=2849641 RepID=A0ABN6I366_9HELI|nr:molybdopterin molybdotransferase MoeA [Helicobacter sp. NHP19-003]BCZ18032.1 Molybdopterin biosynthesis protein MoeA [Helicobacter sp. NHP19-003]